MQQQDRAKRRRATAAGVVIAGIGLLGIEAQAGVLIRRALAPTGVDADARGQTVVAINHNGGRGRLVVRGARLAPASTFSIMLGGVRIGTLATGVHGNGRARFSTRPGRHEQSLGTDPRGKHLEIADDHGEDVLDDDIPDDSVQPGEKACCLADDDGAECEDRTPDECQAEGGKVGDSTSCMPNPCATAPGGDEEVGCCVVRNDEVECERTTVGECAAESGTKVDSCDPNPCAPSSPGVVRCCLPDVQGGGGSGSGRGGSGSGETETENEMECEQLTADHCMQLLGTSMDVGSCDPNPCPAAP